MEIIIIEYGRRKYINMGKNQSKEEKSEEIVIAQSAGGNVNIGLSQYEVMSVIAFVLLLVIGGFLIIRYLKKNMKKSIRRVAHDEVMRMSLANLRDIPLQDA